MRPFTSRLLLIPLAVLAASAIAGCGGDDDDGESSDASTDEQQAVEAVQTYYTAIAEGDAAAGCDALSAEGEQAVLDSATGFAEDFDCEEAIDFVSESTDEETKQKILEIEPTVTDITATTATVETPSYFTDINTGEVEESTIDIEVTKEGDVWKVSSFSE